MNLSRILRQGMAGVCQQTQFRLPPVAFILSSRNITSNSSSSNPDTKEKLEGLLKIFPKNVEEISDLALSRPEILQLKTETVKSIARLLRYHGKSKLLENSDIIALLDNYPELLKVPAAEFEKKLIEMLVSCGKYDLPWKSIIVENPDIIVKNHRTIRITVENLREYFSKGEIYSLIQNNPNVFREDWNEIVQKLQFLMHTMNVSLQTISITPGSLLESLDSYQLRYTFLLRSGNYKHPSGNQIGTRPVEAEPELSRICTTDDRGFLKSCAPNLTLEELNTFKSLHYLEQQELLSPEDNEYDEDMEEYDENFVRGSYFGKKNRIDEKTKKEMKKMKRKRI